MVSLLRRTFGGVANCDVELLSGPRVADSEYTGDVALLSDDFRVVHVALNHLAAEVTIYVMLFALSKCKLLFQDRQ